MADPDPTPAWFTLLAARLAEHDNHDVITVLIPPGYYTPHLNPPRDTTAVR